MLSNMLGLTGWASVRRARSSAQLGRARVRSIILGQGERKAIERKEDDEKIPREDDLHPDRVTQLIYLNYFCILIILPDRIDNDFDARLDVRIYMGARDFNHHITRRMMLIHMG